MMRGQRVRRLLTVAIAGELLATGIALTLIRSWPLEDFTEAEASTKSQPAALQTVSTDATLPSLAMATEAARKPLHRPLFDRPPQPTVVQTTPAPPKKPRPTVKLIGTIADPSGNRGIFETSPLHTEVKRAGDRFEQLPNIEVKRIDPKTAVLLIEGDEVEVALVMPASEGKLP